MKLLPIIILAMFVSGYTYAQQPTKEQKERMLRFFINKADRAVFSDSILSYYGNVRLNILGSVARCDSAFVHIIGHNMNDITSAKTSTIEANLNATLKGNVKIWGADELVVYADSLYIDLAGK